MDQIFYKKIYSQQRAITKSKLNEIKEKNKLKKRKN